MPPCAIGATNSRQHSLTMSQAEVLLSHNRIPPCPIGAPNRGQIGITMSQAEVLLSHKGASMSHWCTKKSQIVPWWSLPQEASRSHSCTYQQTAKSHTSKKRIVRQYTSMDSRL